MTQLILRINEILNTSDEADVTKQDIFESARRDGKFDLIETQNRGYLTSREFLLHSDYRYISENLYVAGDNSMH